MKQNLAHFPNILANKILLTLDRDEHLQLSSTLLDHGEVAASKYIWELINTKYKSKYSELVMQAHSESAYLQSKIKGKKAPIQREPSFANLETALDSIPLIEPFYFLAIEREFNDLFSIQEIQDIDQKIAEIPEADKFGYLKQIYESKSKIKWDDLMQKIKAELVNNMCKSVLSSISIGGASK